MSFLKRSFLLVLVLLLASCYHEPPVIIAYKVSDDYSSCDEIRSEMLHIEKYIKKLHIHDPGVTFSYEIRRSADIRMGVLSKLKKEKKVDLLKGL